MADARGGKLNDEVTELDIARPGHLLQVHGNLHSPARSGVCAYSGGSTRLKLQQAAAGFRDGIGVGFEAFVGGEGMSVFG